MNFSLRDAHPAHLPAIAAIYAEAVENGTASYEMTAPDLSEMQARFKTITGNGYPYLSAIDENGVVLGCAYASAFRTRPAYRFLVEDSIYLAPEARGLGIGKALLAASIERCTALGFRQMVAVIGGAHPASVRLHASAGFTDSGTIRGAGFKHGTWLDTAFMQRALGDGVDTAPSADRYPDTLYR